MALDQVALDASGGEFDAISVPLPDDLAAQVLDGQAAIETLKTLDAGERERLAGVFREKREGLTGRTATEVDVPFLPETQRAMVELQETVRRARIVDPVLDRALPSFYFF